MEVQPGSSFSCSFLLKSTTRLKMFTKNSQISTLSESYCCCQIFKRFLSLPLSRFATFGSVCICSNWSPTSRPACGHKTTGPPQAPKSRYVSSGIRSSAHPASSVTPGHSLFPNQITSELVCFGQWITDHACWRFPSPFLPYLWEYTVHDTTPLFPTVPIQASPCASSLSLPITPCRTPPWQENQSRTKTFE